MRRKKAETTTERFALAIDMFRVGLSLKEAQLRRENPSIGSAAIEAKLKKWLGDKPPPGESGLRRIEWPRSKKRSGSRSKAP